MTSIDPTTERELGEYKDHSPEETDARLQRAEAAFLLWRHTSLTERAKLMHALAGVLRDRVGEYAMFMTREMGKPIVAAESEIEKCADCCEYFAFHAAGFLADEAIASDAEKSFVRFEPLGAVLAIMPWNFPFWQVFRFACPALMAGNVGILKHAPNVPGCAVAIERAFEEAGFPSGVFTTLLVDTPAVKGLIERPLIAAVTLTGSDRAGSSVASIAGASLKKVVLELGGSDPFIVLPDADLPAAAKAAAAARCVNSGQSCIAAKRFIVVGDAPEFERHFAVALAELKVGNPFDRATQVGPIARLDLLENLQRQVQSSIKLGARAVTGGHRLPVSGYFYAPTLLADVRPGMPAFDEETFGPVAAVVAAANIDDAVRLANLTPYGLGASIWTRDLSVAEQIASRLDCGSVFVNGPVKSDPRLPFGGVKRSGYGRELSSFGIREFVNIKTVWISSQSS